MKYYLKCEAHMLCCARLVSADTVEVALPTRAKVLRSRLTLGEMVAAAGWLLSLVTLTQDQLALLACQHPSLYLCGPPGTGEAVWEREREYGIRITENGILFL